MKPVMSKPGVGQSKRPIHVMNEASSTCLKRGIMLHSIWSERPMIRVKEKEG